MRQQRKQFLGNIHTLVVHCTDSGRSVTWAQIDKWHKDRGWPGFGYHGFIDQWGDYWLGRPLNVVGIHVRNHNTNTLGLVLAGTKNPKNAWGEPLGFSRSQFLTAERVIEAWRLAVGGSPKVVGHKDLDPDRKCPFFDTTMELDVYRKSP